MLNIHEYSVDFLNEKLAGPYVELNPVTGRPRLIKGLNGPLDAINELGGVNNVAKNFNVQVQSVNDWVDFHYIPTKYANLIADELGYSDITELQYPSTGYQDAKAGIFWPWSWGLCSTEMDNTY